MSSAKVALIIFLPDNKHHVLLFKKGSEGLKQMLATLDYHGTIYRVADKIFYPPRESHR